MREKVIRMNEMITNAGKRFDHVLNSLNQFFKEMRGDQSGQFAY